MARTDAPLVVTRYRRGHTHPARRGPVTHSYAAMVFVTQGASRFELDGEWSLREGDVVLVPAGAPHRSTSMHEAEAWGVGFCVSCIASDGAGPLLEPFERVRDGASAVVRVPKERRGYLAGLFAELERVLQTKPASLDAVQRSLLTLILAELDVQPAPKSSSGVVTEALRFIERNCLRKLTLKDVAAAVRRSPAYVTTALTRATGKSAVQWIVAGRMAEARRLLAHSDELVDVISERVGYAHPTHFIRLFRREHGVTPAAWRKAQASEPT